MTVLSHTHHSVVNNGMAVLSCSCSAQNDRMMTVLSQRGNTIPCTQHSTTRTEFDQPDPNLYKGIQYCARRQCREDQCACRCRRGYRQCPQVLCTGGSRLCSPLTDAGKDQGPSELPRQHHALGQVHPGYTSATAEEETVQLRQYST